jgi:hypothetical protein
MWLHDFLCWYIIVCNIWLEQTRFKARLARQKAIILRQHDGNLASSSHQKNQNSDTFLVIIVILCVLSANFWIADCAVIPVML